MTFSGADDTNRVATGSAVGIGRLGHYYKVQAGPLNTAKAIYFPFADGIVSGVTGQFEVFMSMDNEDDPYESTGILIDVSAGEKLPIPDAMFRVGWIKLVGPSVIVKLYGVG